MLLALAEKKTAIAKLLILNGADVNASRVLFDHPLQYALATEDLELIRLMIDTDLKMSDANAQLIAHNAGKALLELSIITGDQKLLRFLIQHNPDILIHNNDLLNALINNNKIHENFREHLCHFNNPENRAFFEWACVSYSKNSNLKIWASLFDANQPNPECPRTHEQARERVEQFVTFRQACVT